MTFNVEPEAVRAYAAQLAVAREHAETARNYVSANGRFHADERGLIGYIFPQHVAYMDALLGMLDHLCAITDASVGNLTSIATTYERTDAKAAQRVDASYPEVVRPPLSHEAQERDHPELDNQWDQY